MICVEVIVCYISVIFLRHSVDLYVRALGELSCCWICWKKLPQNVFRQWCTFVIRCSLHNALSDLARVRVRVMVGFRVAVRVGLGWVWVRNLQMVRARFWNCTAHFGKLRRLTNQMQHLHGKEKWLIEWICAGITEVLMAWLWSMTWPAVSRLQMSNDGSTKLIKTATPSAEYLVFNWC